MLRQCVSLFREKKYVSITKKKVCGFFQEALELFLLHIIKTPADLEATQHLSPQIEAEEAQIWAVSWGPFFWLPNSTYQGHLERDTEENSSEDEQPRGENNFTAKIKATLVLTEPPQGGGSEKTFHLHKNYSWGNKRHQSLERTGGLFSPSLMSAFWGDQQWRLLRFRKPVQPESCDCCVTEVSLDYSGSCRHSRALGTSGRKLLNSHDTECYMRWQPPIVLLCFSLAKGWMKHRGLHQYSRPGRPWSLFLGHSSHRLSKSSLISCPFLKSLY